MPPPSQNAVRTWRPSVHSLPAEILSIIFLFVVEHAYGTVRVQLMLVCRSWHDIMLSTPGIPSVLWIRKSTTMEMVRAVIQRTRWLLNVRIDMDDGRIGQDFNMDAFDECFMATIEAASRWQSLVIDSLPRPRTFQAFQIVPPLKSLEFFCLEHGCDLGNFLEPLMAAITTTATPHLTSMSLNGINAVLYLVQPECLHVFCSLTNLTIWLSKRMEIPANILPHLHSVETFYAQHLHLPMYPPGAPLPLARTLRYIRLKSVSVQWMAGKVFPVLRGCDIAFPHYINTICLQPVSMPACTDLKYDSNFLYPLRCFHNLPLHDLTVLCGQWNVRKGDPQLIAICDMIPPYARSLTRLDLQVRCSEQLLIYVLSLLPALKSLYLRLASPCALSETFFRAFVATNSYSDSPYEVHAAPGQPLCLELVELYINYYKRWLRGAEKTALLLVFGDIVSSRRPEEDFRLLLVFEGLAQRWFVWRHVESIHEVSYDAPFVIGIPRPHGIIPLGMIVGNSLMELPFKETEYLVASHRLSIGCLLTLHHLVELRVRGEKGILPSTPPPNLPLFHTLRILEAEDTHPSFIAGRTFHRLDRCRISISEGVPRLSHNQVTQMPVCTRLDVYDLTLLATLKLPQIRELGLSFDHPEFNMIWEKFIAVNVNLSRLELLHVYGWHQQVDLIQALRCLPVLQRLILSNGSDLTADFFEKFVPMHPNENATLMESHDEGQISQILCPMLRSLLIEGCSPEEPVELIPVLKQVISLRAEFGSPLKRFTLSAIEFGRKFELIGSQGEFVVEIDYPDEDTKQFRLDI